MRFLFHVQWQEASHICIRNEPIPGDFVSPTQKMARFEERDPRWIVEERNDGANVKNWHWTEKDCTSWSKTRLSQLLGDVTIIEGNDAPVTVKLTGLEHFSGEAFINNRKNKLFASFDLVLKISYAGDVQTNETASTDKRNGFIQVPNFSDEQDPEDWEFRIVPSQEDGQGCLVKEEIQRKGREKLRRQLMVFVEELRSCTPVHKQGDRPHTEEAKTKLPVKKQREEKQQVSTSAQGFHELHLKEKYHANPQDIFDCFTVAGKLQSFTQSPAKVDVTVGGNFSWFDGAVAGRFIKIQPCTELIFDWRFNNWAEGHFSQVVMKFENPESGLTVLSLHQTKIPEEDMYGNANVVSVTETGWKERILTRIKAVFGYGI